MIKILFLLAVVLCAGPVWAHGGAHQGSAPRPLPTVNGAKIGGAFGLTDHNGKPVTEKAWPGKYKLLFFGYTHCPDICPVVMQKISAVMEKVDPKGAKIVPLFVTVDPARDTAERLKTYIELSYSPTIIGLTGTQAQIKDMLKTYKVYAARRPGQSDAEYADYLADHSSYIYLMSPEDELVEVFAADVEGGKIIEKIKQSVK